MICLSSYCSNIEYFVMLACCALLFRFFRVNSASQLHCVLKNTGRRISDDHVLCLIERRSIVDEQNFHLTFVESVSVKWKSATIGTREAADDICSSTDGQTKPIDMGHVTFAWSVMSQISVLRLKSIHRISRLDRQSISLYRCFRTSDVHSFQRFRNFVTSVWSSS